MNYSYTSHWQRQARSMRLTGVLVVAGDGQNAGAYFPDDAEVQTEWDEVIAGLFRTLAESGPAERLRHLVHRLHKDDTPREVQPSRTALLVWLRRTAASGNGITEEFDEVRPIEADTLENALKNAYLQTLDRYGRNIPEPAPRKGISTNHRDPTAGFWPEGLLRPQNTSRSAKG